MCFGQEIYKVNEGTLICVNFKNGIIVEKDNKYYSLSKIWYDKHPTNIKFNLEEVLAEDVEKIKNDTATVKAEAITDFDYSNFKEHYFITTLNQYTRYLYQYNDEVIAVKFKDSNNSFYHEKAFPFLILDFGN